MLIVQEARAKAAGRVSIFGFLCGENDPALPPNEDLAGEEDAHDDPSPPAGVCSD